MLETIECASCDATVEVFVEGSLDDAIEEEGWVKINGHWICFGCAFYAEYVMDELEEASE
jgi:hypothetical protein